MTKVFICWFHITSLKVLIWRNVPNPKPEKKEVMRFLFKINHNVSSWPRSAIYGRDDTDVIFCTIPLILLVSYTILSSIWTLFMLNYFRSEEKVMASFKDVLVSKPFVFYCICIFTLINRWWKRTNV